MKVLIVYDTFSTNRNTEKVATAINDELRSKGVESKSLSVEDANPELVKSYDCLIVGGPTHMRRPTGSVMRFIDSLARQKLSGKAAAAFDTRAERRFAGAASDKIEKKLRKLGFKMIVASAAFYVERTVKGKDIHRSHDFLKEGEIDKAAEFADQIAKSLR
jgi:flavodoxin